MDHGSGTLLAHPAQVALGEMDAALDGFGAVNLWSLPDADLLELRVAQERTLARLQSTILATTREIDERGAAVATGAHSTAGWLRGRLLIHPGAAKAEATLAADLASDFTETGGRLAAGEITRDQAAAVVLAVHKLPRGVAAETRAEAETFLLDQARTFDPAALHNLGRHLILRLDPDGGQALEREEARQHDRQAFTLVHHHDGSWSSHGQFAPEGGALFDAALGAVAAPRTAADGTPDPRPAPLRRAEGLLELLRLALTAPDMPEHGGEPVTLLVTAPVATLRSPHHDDCDGSGPGGQGPDRSDGCAGCGEAPSTEPATFADGTPMSPETARRLGCDAWLVAAIIASGPEVLDIGRLSRTPPRGIRRALVARDGGCAFPDCGRPARWCHAHHIWHWADGGPTAVSNLVLLCGHHHRVIHHDGWDVWLDEHGRPGFRPPRWIDPVQHPRPAWRPPTLHGLPVLT